MGATWNFPLPIRSSDAPYLRQTAPDVGADDVLRSDKSSNKDIMLPVFENVYFWWKTLFYFQPWFEVCMNGFENTRGRSRARVTKPMAVFQLFQELMGQNTTLSAYLLRIIYICVCGQRTISCKLRLVHGHNRTRIKRLAEHAEKYSVVVNYAYVLT